MSTMPPGVGGYGASCTRSSPSSAGSRRPSSRRCRSSTPPTSSSGVTSRTRRRSAPGSSRPRASWRSSRPTSSGSWRAAFAEFWRGDARRSPLYERAVPRLPLARRVAPLLARPALCVPPRPLRVAAGPRCAPLEPAAEGDVGRGDRPLDARRPRRRRATAPSSSPGPSAACSAGSRASPASAGSPPTSGSGWAQLYLAPPVGALAAWAGLHVWLVLQEVDAVGLQTIITPDQPGRRGPRGVRGVRRRPRPRLLRAALRSPAAPGGGHHRAAGHGCGAGVQRPVAGPQRRVPSPKTAAPPRPRRTATAPVTSCLRVHVQHRDHVRVDLADQRVDARRRHRHLHGRR